MSENLQDSPLKFLKRNLKIDRLTSLLKRGVISFKREGLEATYRKIDFRIKLMTKGEVFKFRSDIPLKRELKEQRETVFNFMPKISIVVPLFNTDDKFLKEMIESVLQQSYQNFELVLVDASDKKDLSSIISSYKSKKIIYKKLLENKSISENTNEGFKLCTGDYISLLDHDDVLYKNALYENVKAINENGADLIYSDEIVLSGDLKKLSQFHFKIDYAPDYLRNLNYITHFLVFKKELFEKAGAYQLKEYNGAQDFDLILRLTENAQKIHHIPKVLYIWRSHENSTASDMTKKMYAFEAGKKAIEDHLNRIGLKGTVEISEYNGSYKIQYEIIDNPLVSIIIPNKDNIDDLEKCLDSVYKYSGYDNFEIIVVENNSNEDKTFEFYKKAEEKYENLKVVYYKGSFNFSAICNFGVDFSKGEHILLLNNDIEFIKKNAIKELLSYSQRSDVGAVGAKLLYPDDTIQHGGVIIGINGSAGHSHKGLKSDTTGDLYRLVTVQNYLAVTGACLMTKRSLYKKYPLNEEIFAVAYNDVDYCLNLYKAGFINVFTPHTLAYHYESKSRGLDETDKPNLRYEKEKEEFYRKWGEFFNYNDPYYNPHFTLLFENYGYK